MFIRGNSIIKKAAVSVNRFTAGATALCFFYSADLIGFIYESVISIRNIVCVSAVSDKRRNNVGLCPG